MLYTKYKYIYKSIQGSSSSVQYLQFIYTLSSTTSSVAAPFLKFICPIHIAKASCSVEYFALFTLIILALASKCPTN